MTQQLSPDASPKLSAVDAAAVHGPFSARDDIFRTVEEVGDFRFDAKVVTVFDDMLNRSVPFYGEVQRMVAELAQHFVQDGVIYDIGCSTGNTLLALTSVVDADRDVRFVGIEPSEAMRDKAGANLSRVERPERVDIRDGRVEAMAELPDAAFVTMLYTLQFVRPIHRLNVLQMVHRSLKPGGCLVLAEKILGDDPELRRLFIDLYHDYKHRCGYSRTEIAKKRESLENVLVPLNGCENLELLRQSGFQTVETVFRWYNWAVYLAVKS